jgi:hypothetical protein
MIEIAMRKWFLGSNNSRYNEVNPSGVIHKSTFKRLLLFKVIEALQKNEPI